MLKQALAVVALVSLAGCSAGVAVDPNRTSSRSDYDRDNARVTYRTDTTDSTNARTYDRTYDRTTSDRNYDANARVAADRTSYSYSDRNSNDQPIMTDPIGRPELMSRKLDNEMRDESANSGRTTETRTTYNTRSDLDTNRGNGASASASVSTPREDGFNTRNDRSSSEVTYRSDTDTARTAGARADVNVNTNTRSDTSASGNVSGSANMNVGDRGSDNLAKLAAQDRQFVDGAASAGLFEVRSAQLVKDKISDNDAKQFAQMMIDDHTKANNELKDILSRKNITPPSEMRTQHQTLYNNLSSMTGNDLWNQYKQIQVTAHEQVIKLFQDEINNGQDSDLKAFAQKYLPVLQQHLEGAKMHMNMKDDMNK